MQPSAVSAHPVLITKLGFLGKLLCLICNYVALVTGDLVLWDYARLFHNSAVNGHSVVLKSVLTIIRSKHARCARVSRNNRLWVWLDYYPYNSFSVLAVVGWYTSLRQLKIRWSDNECFDSMRYSYRRINNWMSQLRIMVLFVALHDASETEIPA